MIDQLINQAAALIRQSNHMVALTGAGISTPSGIPDFRSTDSGLWEKHDPFEVSSIQAFRQHPERFYEWLRPLAQKIHQAQPNPAHIVLAQLEAHGPLKAVITQNIDLLHTHAGSKRVYEVHGHIRETTCLHCHANYPANNMMEALISKGQLPLCPHCGDILKPNVVLIGELLSKTVLLAAEQHNSACDLMLVAGSSLQVMPVSNMPWQVKMNGAKLIIVNFDSTYLDNIADVVINGDVAEILPRLAASFLP